MLGGGSYPSILIPGMYGNSSRHGGECDFDAGRWRDVLPYIPAWKPQSISAAWNVVSPISPTVGETGETGTNEGHIYEFGVFNGKSLGQLRYWYPDVKIWGFDSFEGLPEEDKSDVRQKDWAPGK